jgi:Domain of unknown function (DUF4349)
MPASETVDFEREFEELVRELRALPADAPASVRERVRALGEPEPRRVFPQLTWRRAVVVLVPACVLAVVAAAAVHGLLSSSSSKQAGTFAKVNPAETRSAPNHLSSSGAKGTTFEGAPTFDQAQQHSTTLTPPSSGVPIPNPGRYQNYQADLRVRVKDLDALGDKTARAMQITQQLGGFVASVSQSSTAGQPGESDLVLRIPVARVTDAMVQLAALGTVVEQHVSIVDLQRVVEKQRQQIRALQLQIARINAALQQPGLSADERLRLQFLLDDARRNLANATGKNKATLREAALSRIALSLTTEKPIVPAKKHHSSFFGRAVSSAFDFLAGAGAVTVAALIILSPLLVLGVLIWLGVRTFRRREAQRLLGTT